MVSAEDVVEIYKRLMKNGIQVWLTGGWGIDALLGERIRLHKDLDDSCCWRMLLECVNFWKATDFD